MFGWYCFLLSVAHVVSLRQLDVYTQRQQIEGEIQKRQNALRLESRNRREEAKRVRHRDKYKPVKLFFF